MEERFATTTLMQAEKSTHDDGMRCGGGMAESAVSVAIQSQESWQRLSTQMAEEVDAAMTGSSTTVSPTYSVTHVKEVGGTMNTELQVYQKPLSAVEIRSQVNLIQEVMKSVMKDATHYGIIPGCQKPCLWKPGAEVLFATFHIAVDPTVEDLSTPDEARFRITAHAKSNSGTPLGSAVGEASSDEEKYKWREMVCQEEFDETPGDLRRRKWKKSKNGAYAVNQVRTNIADCRNTILKMASKRAYVALALQVTAASDIFTQDVTDLPAEIQDIAINGDAEPVVQPMEIRRKEPASVTTPQAQVLPPKAGPVVTPRPVVQSPKPAAGRVITEPQSRRFYAIYKQAGRTNDEVKAYLQEHCGVTDSRQIPADPKSLYENACAWAEGKEAF
jgi:hypothetical protein